MSEHLAAVTTAAAVEEEGQPTINEVLSLIQDKEIEAEFGQYIWEEIVACTNKRALSDLLTLIAIRLQSLSH